MSGLRKTHQKKYGMGIIRSWHCQSCSLHRGVSSQHVAERSTRNTAFSRCFPSSLGSLALGSFCFPDPGSRAGKIGKTDVRKDLSLLAPSEVRYPAGLAGVIKSRVIIYPRASLASHVPRSKSGIMLPTEMDSHGFEGEPSLPLRVLIHL